MKTITQAQLDSFHRFASERLAEGAPAMSIHMLVDLWTSEMRSRHQGVDVVAVREALADMEAGDRGRPAEQVIDDVSEEFGLERA